MFPNDRGNMYSNMKPFFLNSFVSQKKINSPDACRLCLRVEGVMTHYSSEMAGTVDLAGQIFECLGISFPIEMTQKELVQICHRCVYAVSRFYEFKMRCQELHILQRRFQRRSSTPSETTDHSMCSILPGSERSLLYTDGSDLDTDMDISAEWSQTEDEDEEETVNEPKDHAPNNGIAQAAEPGEISMPSLDRQPKSNTHHKRDGMIDFPSSPPNLDVEHRVASNVQQKTCSELSIIFNRGFKRDRENKNKQVQCSVCDKTFKGVRYLKRHMSVHNKSKLKCEECGKLYKSHNGFMQHKQTHSGKVHPCENCNRVFKSELSLLYHSRRIHRRKKETKVSKRLTKKRNLVSIEKEQNVRWTCFGCNLIFSQADKFYAHFKTCYYKSSNDVLRESNYNPNKDCLDMDKKTLNSSTLLDMDKKTLNSSTSMDMDKKILKSSTFKTKYKKICSESAMEIGKAPVQLCCQNCTNKYANVDDLMEHEIVVHKLFKVFTCRECAKTFTYKSYSVAHEKSHISTSLMDR